MYSNQIIKMKDGELVTIDCGNINQIKELIEQYCGSEFLELLNFDDLSKDSDYYIYIN